MDREALDVCSERVDDDLWQRDRAVRRGGLGRGEAWWAAREQDQLLVDPQRAGSLAEAVVDHAEALALPQSGTGGEHDEGAIARTGGPIRSGNPMIVPSTPWNGWLVVVALGDAGMRTPRAARARVGGGKRQLVPRWASTPAAPLGAARAHGIEPL